MTTIHIITAITITTTDIIPTITIFTIITTITITIITHVELPSFLSSHARSPPGHRRPLRRGAAQRGSRGASVGGTSEDRRRLNLLSRTVLNLLS